MALENDNEEHPTICKVCGRRGDVFEKTRLCITCTRLDDIEAKQEKLEEEQSAVKKIIKKICKKLGIEI